MVEQGQLRAGHLDDSSPELVELLRAEIAAAGQITFARFMDVALYHPQHGYYAGAAVRAGVEGDFLTGPETDPIFGHALARQVAECWDHLGRPHPFTVREFGAGRGTLATQIIAGLQAARPDALAALRYELADINPARLAEAQARSAILQPATAAPITGIVLANELLDALPFHRLIQQQGELHELWVGWRDGWFADEPGPLSAPELALPLAGLALGEGQRVEVSPAAWAWAAGIGGQLTRGYALLIDYGYPAEELYAPQRHEGTLKTYRAHAVSAEPFRHIGRQDITAHVDFSAIGAAAARGGMQVLGRVSQAYFFAGLGIEELLLDLHNAGDPYRYVSAREAVMHLLDPRGLGRFQVLALGSGVEDTPALRGLSFALPGRPLG